MGLRQGRSSAGPRGQGNRNLLLPVPEAPSDLLSLLSPAGEVPQLRPREAPLWAVALQP